MSSPHSDFRNALLDAARPNPTGLIAPGGRPAGRRFDVYRNNVIVGLMDALETGFPVLRKIIGPGTFRNLARLHAAAHPPVSPLMIHYGSDMPAFLERFEPLAHLPYLADVARLELAIRAAYHAGDAPPLPIDRVQTLSPDQLMASRLVLAPAVRVLASDWPIASIWMFNTSDDAPKPEMRPEDVLVARPAYDPAPHVLPQGGAAFLGALAQGRTLAEASAHVAEADVGALFGVCVSNGVFTDICEAP
jgi:hypothetical protein